MQCAAAGLVSTGRGVESSDLTCMTATLGTAKDSLVWGYKDLKPLTSIEFVSSSNIGGGYGTTAIAVGDALKAEGLLGSYTVKYFSNAPLGVGYFKVKRTVKICCLSPVLLCLVDWR